MPRKLPSSVMVLGVVSNEGHVMPPHIFLQGLRVNAVVHIEVLDKVVKPWINSVCNRRLDDFQQDSAPSHKAQMTQEWMAGNLHDHITTKIWPPNSPDLNPLDYYVLIIVQKIVNEHPHSTKDSLKAAIVRAMFDMNKDHMIRACKRFQPCVEAVFDAYGGFIE
ncbi:uncharacterized protein LOC106873612 [Octopus bimaculoides]|uniref:uncharacterized protein LOC106873612 n=1 Tax=Octopus bimaculoides TaxID=37653 RepID=UPI00071CBCAE|nr:uncharacterized protein LOC106873612 [Octopus bimaculoides]|eukprot:XP_014776542.1 PREDICTED: uncharacterized protein LOC106873612 [Octopus bimaculoides]